MIINIDLEEHNKLSNEELGKLIRYRCLPEKLFMLMSNVLLDIHNFGFNKQFDLHYIDYTKDGNNNINVLKIRDKETTFIYEAIDFDENKKNVMVKLKQIFE